MKRPTIFHQYDYKNVKYGDSTISRAGCGTTCFAMVLNTLVGKSFTPITEANWSYKHGYKAVGGGTAYTYFITRGKEFGIKCSYIGDDDSLALAEVKKGNWVIACMGPGNWTKGGHYILLYGFSNGKFLINDPASVLPRRTMGDKKLLQKQDKYYIVVDRLAYEKANTKKSTSANVKIYTYKTIPDATSKSDWVLKYQKACNKLGYKGFDGKKLKEDGLFGKNTAYACPKIVRGTENAIVKLIQYRLKDLGFNPNGVDGVYGKDPQHGMYDAVIKYKKSATGATTKSGDIDRGGATICALLMGKK